MGLMGKQFRYTLTYNNEDFEIEAPRGWDEDTVANYKRSTEFFGIIRGYSLPLRFVLNGRDILRSALLINGVTAGVRLHIERINYKGWNYETAYKGDVDFSEYQDDGIEFSVTLMEAGISEDIKAKSKVTYEFPLTGPEVVNVELPGIDFSDRILWTILPSNSSDLNSSKTYVPPIDLITQSESGFLEGFNVEQRNASTSDNFSGDVFIRCTKTGGVTARIRMVINAAILRAPLQNNVLLTLQVRSTNNFVFQQVIVNVNSNDYPVGITPISRTIEFDYYFQQGEGLFLLASTNSSGTSNHIVIGDNGEIEANFSSRSDASTTKGIKSFDMFKKIMTRVSPGTEVNSDMLSLKWANLIFTSGSAIREIEDAKIKVSLDDFFAAFKSLEDGAIGSENGIFRLETGSFFARRTQIANVGNVNSCLTSPAVDFMANQINIGFDDKNTNETDGLQEYNSRVEYTTPTPRINNTLDWVSPIRADQYGIENMRINYNIKKRSTSDNESDNDTFMIHCNPIQDGKYTPILGSQLEGVSGLINPDTSYNLLISPKLNLLRHSGYLRSILDLQDGRFIEFASAEKNSNLAVTLAGKISAINQSVSVSSLDGKYFRPYVFTITPKFPINIFQLIESTPFGYITFNFNGIEASGYILEAEVDLAGNAAKEIKLLAIEDSLIP